VVLGGGGGGLFAAVEAAAAGAKVILLESMPTVGGSSAICGGDIVFAGTDLQKGKGIEDSDKLLYSDFMKAGKNRNIP
jgi:fumarate reductase flavoprotein subunit